MYTLFSQNLFLLGGGGWKLYFCFVVLYRLLFKWLITCSSDRRWWEHLISILLTRHHILLIFFRSYFHSLFWSSTKNILNINLFCIMHNEFFARSLQKFRRQSRAVLVTCCIFIRDGTKKSVAYFLDLTILQWSKWILLYTLCKIKKR